VMPETPTREGLAGWGSGESQGPDL